MKLKTKKIIYFKHKCNLIVPLFSVPYTFLQLTVVQPIGDISCNRVNVNSIFLGVLKCLPEKSLVMTDGIPFSEKNRHHFWTIHNRDEIHGSHFHPPCVQNRTTKFYYQKSWEPGILLSRNVQGQTHGQI